MGAIADFVRKRGLNPALANPPAPKLSSKRQRSVTMPTMTIKSKPPLAQLAAERKARREAMMSKVENAGILGILKREKEAKFKRGNAS